jgi:hypothetical protein
LLIKTENTGVKMANGGIGALNAGKYKENVWPENSMEKVSWYLCFLRSLKGSSIFKDPRLDGE